MRPVADVVADLRYAATNIDAEAADLLEQLDAECAALHDELADLYTLCPFDADGNPVMFEQMAELWRIAPDGWTRQALQNVKPAEETPCNR